MKAKKYIIDFLLLPMVGLAASLIIWQLLSGHVEIHKNADGTTEEVKTGVVKDLPSPATTWEKTSKYVLKPFEKREELDQGVLRFTWYSLLIVAKGYAIALILGTPLGFFLGLSKAFTKMFDPIIQLLRPVSPLAWLPLGVVLFSGAGKQANEMAALFTIAVCSMWPTVLNTAVGVRAIPQDYLNVAKVLKLSRTQTLFKILIPATLPYMFTGYRLSLGIAWLVIVAVEMLTGRIGVGNFLWNEYNNGLYTSIILCILTIGLVGFVLDRGMSLLEKRFKSI
ncbi:MAG TPA: nitrate ABC transporter permease [Candidatus Limnocylindria bacterium]|jgi:nitrate/nitrite transport system permease protein|nr:nitrate ABC transporter permease [Candidatus Limnocylindria bacterium]